jgi:hypothetical protein
VTYGGDSGNRIFVLYWRYPLITVSIIRGSTVLDRHQCFKETRYFHFQDRQVTAKRISDLI